ncbi:MarR family winged helix-turn-helix transcriptional regulator [Microbacterium sp. M1A1_1b]
MTEDRADSERALRQQLDRLWVRQALRSVLIEDRGGLDPTARVILRAVERLGPVRATTVAELTGLSRPVVSRRVASLVSAGHLGTTPDPEDGRASLLELAPAGRSLLDQLDVHGDETFDDIVGEFADDDLRALAVLLGRLNDRADDVLRAAVRRR